PPLSPHPARRDCPARAIDQPRGLRRDRPAPSGNTMSAAHLGWLLRLYPCAWRRRYADEFADLLVTERPTPRLVLDLALGALDAHLCPQTDRGTRHAEAKNTGNPHPISRVPRAAFCVRSMIARALIALPLLAGALRHADTITRAGAAIADRL